MIEPVIDLKRAADALVYFAEISEMNKMARVYHSAANNLGKRITEINEWTEGQHEVIASKKIKIKASATLGHSTNGAVVFKLMKVNYQLINNGSEWFGLYLNLVLTCDAGVFSFPIAKTHTDGCPIKATKGIEKHLLIGKGAHHCIVFENLEDFRTVIAFCNEAIEEFNNLLPPKGEKMVKHIENYS